MRRGVMHESRNERYLMRQVSKTSADYGLLAAGDRILVALSGGKDSYSMLHLMERLRVRLPFAIELVAVHLDQQQPGYDGKPLRDWLDRHHYRYEILSEDTYSVVIDKTVPGGTYCSLCSRLRRGILYTAAERLGCNKIALGHHREDTIETFMLNLLYAGKLQAMPAKYRTDDGRFEVIRPLIECAEKDIAALAVEKEFPILPCNLCGSQDGLKREAVGALIGELEKTNPRIRAVMLAALSNVRPTHLLDREVGEAWQVRPAHIRPADTEAATPSLRHASALPVFASEGGSVGGANDGHGGACGTVPLRRSAGSAEPLVATQGPGSERA